MPKEKISQHFNLLANRKIATNSERHIKPKTNTLGNDILSVCMYYENEKHNISQTNCTQQLLPCHQHDIPSVCIYTGWSSFKRRKCKKT